jgi:hypothetical protein
LRSSCAMEEVNNIPCVIRLRAICHGDPHLRNSHLPAKHFETKRSPTARKQPPASCSSLLLRTYTARLHRNPNPGSRRQRGRRKWRTPSRGCRTTLSSRETMRSRASTTPRSSSSTAPSPRLTSEPPPWVP